MKTSNARIGWVLWLQWMLASILGFAVGAAIGNAIAITALFGAILGITGGFMQWLVLRRRIAGAGWWVLASALGFAIAPMAAITGVMALAQVMSLDRDPLAAPILMGILFGVLSGILPWLILRQQVARASWWVLPTCSAHWRVVPWALSHSMP